MPNDPFTLAHIAAGLPCIALYWLAITQQKGSARHRRYGKWFVWSWIPLLASVAGILLFASDKLEPPRVVQFIYLSLCVFAVTSTAWLAIRWKHDLPAFRGLWFKLTGFTTFAMALVVLAAGIATADPLPIIFSVIGLLYGGAMMRFSFLREVHPNWSLVWHLNGMSFLFNAVHGTVLAVLWRLLVDPGAGDEVTAVTHLGTMAISLWIRLHFGRLHGAPLRLAADRRTALA